MAAVIKVVTVVGREAKGKCLTSATAMLTTDDEATFDSAYIIEPKNLNSQLNCRMSTAVFEWNSLNRGLCALRQSSKRERQETERD